MIPATTFSGQRVAVFGLGASGTATVQSLLAGGADVAAWDDGERSRDAAVKAGLPVIDLKTADWGTFAALVLAPGVPLTHPEPHWTVKRAAAAGVEVIGDIEIFCRERARHWPQAPFVAITGTNGKSTTTALIAHILGRAGIDAQMGGNIGRAILTLDAPSDAHKHPARSPLAPSDAHKHPERVYVIEMSSFQIDLTPSLKPTVGVLLNLSPDHLDRHGPANDPEQSMHNYAAIKERLVAAADAACFGVEDTWTRAIGERLEDADKPCYPFTTGKGAAVVPRLYAIGSTLFVHETQGIHASSTEIATLNASRTLRGRHNTQNALAALSALRALKDRLDAQGSPGSGAMVWDLSRLSSALAKYPGLPHRMEEVGRAGRVLFINDSKATNADSTDKALATWNRDIFWILGGKPKEGGIAALAAFFPRIAKAYLIGEASDAFAATLDGHVAYERCGTLDVATARAAVDAGHSLGAEPVVLLSPACASYDQFRGFDHRGDVFRELVRALPGVRP
ncbi:MAG: Mur ligase family protein [Hyphomicrobiaceae bacterium]